MKMRSLLTTVATLFTLQSFAAEQATVKIIPNAPVAYLANIDVDVKQKTAAGLAHRGSGSFLSNMDLEINDHTNPVNLLMTFKRVSFDLKLGGLSIAYDTKVALSGNPIPTEKETLDQFIGKTFKIPLTTDPNYQADPSDPYLLPLPQDPELQGHFAAAVKEILKALHDGVTFTLGESHEDNQETKYGFVRRKWLVTAIDNEKVVRDEEISLNLKWEEPQENGGGGIAITGGGTMKKTIQRSNMLICNGKGTITLNIAEIPGAQGKQLLNDGDLTVVITMDVSSQKENIATVKALRNNQ